MTATAPTAAISIHSLPCEVIVPTGLRKEIFRSGMQQARLKENRQFARMNLGHDQIRIGVRFAQSLPAVARTDQWKAGILVDLSKSGMQLLFHEQLYPQEIIRIAMDKEGGVSLVSGQVAWCRRLASCCFAAGVKLNRA